MVMNNKVFQYSCEFANHADGASRFIYDVRMVWGLTSICLPTSLIVILQGGS